MKTIQTFFCTFLTALFVFQANAVWASDWSASASATSATGSPFTADSALLIDLQVKPVLLPEQTLPQLQIWQGDTPPNWLWLSSFILPGAGQLLMEKWPEALGFFLGVSLSLSGAAVTHFYLTDALADNPAALGLIPIGTLLLLVSALGLYIWNIVNAFFLNRELSPELSRQSAPPYAQALKTLRTASSAHSPSSTRQSSAQAPQQVSFQLYRF